MSSHTPTPTTPRTSSPAPGAKAAPGPSEPGEPSRRRSQEERRSQAEQSLLDAAARLFARRGVDQTSLAEVGEEAGYSRGLASHHFGSKAALVERLAQRSQRHFVDSLGEIGGQELQALVTLVEAYLTALSENRGEVRAFYVMWGAALPEDAPLRSVFVADDARFRQAVEELVRAGQQNRTIRTGIDPVGVSIALVGQLRGTGAQFLIDPEGVDIVAARTACTQFVHHALTPGPAAAPD
jgi:AcrR family transcriptional regulator